MLPRHLMSTIVISVFIVVAAKCPSYAQEHSVVKVPIEVDSLSDDSVGERLAFQLRERIRQSTGYSLTSTNEPHMVLVLRTMDRDCLGKNKSTIYSIVWTFKKDNVNLIIFGHSHSALNKKRGNIVYFNPGSPTDKIFALHNSYGIIEINDKIETKIIKI